MRYLIPLLTLCACGAVDPADNDDAGPTDSGVLDAGTDAGTVDAGPADAGFRCTPGAVFCGTDGNPWRCTYDGNDAVFFTDCSAVKRTADAGPGYCATPTCSSIDNVGSQGDGFACCYN